MRWKILNENQDQEERTRVLIRVRSEEHDFYYVFKPRAFV